MKAEWAKNSIMIEMTVAIGSVISPYKGNDHPREEGG